MIDTDKYEGHTPAPWLWYEEDEGLDLVVADDQCRTVIEEVKALNTKADAELMADAPLLLEEVKRLQTIMYEIEAHNGVSAEVIAASSDALFMNELLAEVKRLREDNELYLTCIHASHFRNKPGSAMSKLNQVRFDQGKMREHEGAVRRIYGKNPQSFVPVCEECGFPVDPYNERFPPGADCICDLKEAEE